MDNRIFYHKFRQMKADKDHSYKRAFVYVISQDPAMLKSSEPYFKVGLSYDNILRRFSDYQTCFREFVVHALYEFPLKDVKKAEAAIHKQLPDAVFYREYVTAGTVYPIMEREKTKTGYVVKEVGKRTANKDMLVDTYKDKKMTEWFNCKLGVIYAAINVVLENNIGLNTITGYKMSDIKITELSNYKMEQLDDSVYVSKSQTLHKKAHKTTLQFIKGSFYNVIDDPETGKLTKKKINSDKFPVVIVDGTDLEGFSYWPAQVKKTINTTEGKMYNVHYFNENTFDSVYPSQTSKFVKATYTELSKKTTEEALQKALDMAYEYLYDKKPPKKK